jgi:hypothetical protein
MTFTEFFEIANSVTPDKVNALKSSDHNHRWEYRDATGDFLEVEVQKSGGFVIRRPTSDKYATAWFIDPEFAQWIAIVSGLIAEVEK